MPEKEIVDRAECRFWTMRVKHSWCTTVLGQSVGNTQPCCDEEREHASRASDATIAIPIDYSHRRFCRTKVTPISRQFFWREG